MHDREAGSTLHTLPMQQQVENADLEMWEHHIESEIESNDQLLETEREALIVARRGQGLFKQRVMQVENRCRITGVTNPMHLRSHCKPWRDSSNEERINGENGLLLTPTVDHLFDRGFISFEDSGLLIVSPVAHPASLNLMGVTTDHIINVGTFTQGQKQFLDYHRESVLLQARH
jgi:putative restriction endonuclease